MTLVKRKRPRDSSEDLQCIPIAKRLHGLNLTATDDTNDFNEEQHVNQTCFNPDDERRAEVEARLQGQMSHQQKSVEQHQHDHLSNHGHHSSMHPSYEPSLDSQANPVYYEMNRVLFEAHVFRLNRCSSLTASSSTTEHHKT